MGQIHIIIGTAAAGMSAANTLRMLDAQATIICVSDEMEQPYNKCHLADYLAGTKTEEQILTLTLQRAAEKNIQLLLGRRVVAIDAIAQAITLADGTLLAYDTLLIATGTSPVIPQIPGIDLVQQGLFTFHGLKDANALRAYRERHKPRNAVIIGAGLSGLECADALINQVETITVIERGNQVLPRIIPVSASSCIEQAMATQGIQLRTNETVVAVISEHGNVIGVRMSSGAVIPTDLLVCAVGVRPNISLAEQAGIAVGDGGILVDPYMRTSISTIFAAGDIVLVPDQLSGMLVPSRTWPDAMLQGLVAAHAMAGKEKRYPGVAVITCSAMFGLKVASCGDIEGQMVN